MKCDICRSKEGVVVRFGEKSIHTMCCDCIESASGYATKHEMIFMVIHIPMFRKEKCEEGGEFAKDCYNKIATFIWLRSFKDWIIQNRRLK